MSKKLFLKEEIAILSKNKYVKKVTKKGITYSDEFKRVFIAENEKGKSPKDIFIECGFDINILGLKRIQSSSSRWRSAFRRNGINQLQDTRKYNTGRPSQKNLSLEKKYEKLQVKIKLLQAENELLKKLEELERSVIKKK